VEEAQADVWKFNMHFLHGQFHSLFSFLEGDETKRYKKIIGICKQRNNMACRGLLRLVVSLYTRDDPKQIQFSYNSYGKPFVLSHPAYLFNTSHSGNWLYIMVSQTHEVGIDWRNLITNIFWESRTLNVASRLSEEPILVVIINNQKESNMQWSTKLCL
jgi:4'-phosphopantetheinyl transferase